MAAATCYHARVVRRAICVALVLVLAGCADGGGVADAGRREPTDPNSDDGAVLELDASEGRRDAGRPCSDSDGDGVCDPLDACSVGDDRLDGDGDFVPDACDCDASTRCSGDASCEDGAAGVLCTCNPGFTGDGIECDPSDCGAPPPPANGRVSADRSTVGGTATYSCDAGYSLVGDERRTCRADGRWSGTVPSCLLGDCGPLSSPENGSVSAAGTTVGSTATYSCDEGFTLGAGDATRTCQADGSWSGAPPTCFLVDCGTLSPPANGAVETDGTRYLSTATYACDVGHELVGGATRTCQADGRWSGSAPTCRVADCGPLAAPDDGAVSAPSTTFGGVATYSCDGGFTLSGDATRTCQADGTWSGDAPVCTSSGCGAPPAPTGGTVTAPSTMVGAFASYACDAGRQINGSLRRVCRDDLNWLGRSPTCGEALSCGCGGTYAGGERVTAAVATPSGATGVTLGQRGTIVAAQEGPSTLQVLVQWDGWTGGHAGNCSIADCGTCVDRPERGRWWTACDQIASARLPCSCDGAYHAGDRVVAIVDAPASARGVTVGQAGTVIAGNAPPSTLGLLVEWDAWTMGHDGNCGASECGACTPSSSSNRWYVPCDSVAIAP